MESTLRKTSSPLLEFERLLWFCKIIVCCLASFGIGWFLIFSLRKISKKTAKLTKLYFVVLAAPIAVYIILSISVRYSLCERAVADGFSFGVVMGILCNLSNPPSERGSVELITHQVNGKKHSVWLDSKDVLVGDARNAIAESMHIVPASRICIESGRGSFLDDLNAKLFRYLVGTTIKVNFFGFTTISCYISIKDEEIVVSPIDEDKTNQRDRSNTHFRSLISNIKGEARYGHQLMLTAKVATANPDVRPLFVSPVEKFAAAAPIQQLAVPSTLSACKNVRLLSWNAVNAAAPPSEIGGSEFGDSHTIQSSGSNCPPVPTSALSRSRSIIDTANRLYKSALQPSDESIRNGDLVVIECDGKFMSVTRGWWMAWSSTVPRRSGAFKIEILERNQRQLENSLRNIKEQFENLGDKFTSKAANFSIQNHLKETDCHLRTGDSFRLRSVKFPEYEMGVTSVKLKDEFCYVGLRKIDNVSHSSRSGEEWCLPVRFSVKVNHLSNKMFKM